MSYLDKIIEYKRYELKVQIRKTPLELLKEQLPAASCNDSHLFRSAIAKQSNSIIAEIKRKSPSKGAINDKVDPVKQAKLYEHFGASAISVLTDGNFFSGSTDDLKIVKSSVSIPILRKDFIFDSYQVYESKIIGADALLLISGVLSPDEFSALYNLAMSLGMDVLVEVETPEDIAKIRQFEPDIIGVNNRNLHTFAESTENSISLSDILPQDALRISESCINKRSQIDTLIKYGYTGFLIGEALMKATDPSSLLNSFVKA